MLELCYRVPNIRCGLAVMNGIPGSCEGVLSVRKESKRCNEWRGAEE